MRVNLDNEPHEKYTFSVWSLDRRPLQFMNFEARDNYGLLPSSIVGHTDLRSECSIILRTPLRFGQAVELSWRYTCRSYYADVTQQCVDLFSMSVPTRQLDYTFVFPFGSAVLSFDLFGQIDSEKFGQHFLTTIEDQQPIVRWHLGHTVPGYTSHVRFQLRRN